MLVEKLLSFAVLHFFETLGPASASSPLFLDQFAESTDNEIF